MFAEHGYDRATVRAIAHRAGVDAAMVNHWFGGKQGLFAQAILHVPFDYRDLPALVTADGPDHVGENIVRTFVTLWDGAGGEVFVGLVRSVTTHEQALAVLKETLVNGIIGEVALIAAADRAELRAALCATQLVGLGMMRYVVGLEPVASAEVEQLVATIGPTLQRYLTGEPGPPG